MLSRVFRGKFIAFLKQAYARGELKFHGQLRSLAQPVSMENLLNRSVKHDWVVYAKRPFGGPAVMLKYLARYTHRVAISNTRLLHLADGRVTFRWKDYAQGNQQRAMTLAATEFIRRFLLHVLPSGFVRIRSYGFLANRVRAQNLERCRQLLGQRRSSEPEPLAGAEAPGVFSVERCPVCKQGLYADHREVATATIGSGHGRAGQDHEDDHPRHIMKQAAVSRTLTPRNALAQCCGDALSRYKPIRKNQTLTDSFMSASVMGRQRPCPLISSPNCRHALMRCLARN